MIKNHTLLIAAWGVCLSLLSSGLSHAEPVFPPEYNLPDEKLLLGIALNDMERVEAAFEDSARLEAEFSEGGNRYSTPLQVAALLGRKEIASHLLQRGAIVADPNEISSRQPIFVAAFHNQADILSLLLPHLLDKEGATEMVRSAFKTAIARGNLEAARALVQGGFDPKTGLFEGDNTSGIKKRPFQLQEAAEAGDPAVVKYLVEECGLDLNQGVASNWYGSPLFAATMWGNVEVVRYLIAKGADINAPSAGEYHHGGYSPLAIALRYGRVECARLLLKAGADPDVKDPKYSPILQADLVGYKEFVEHFESKGQQSPLWDLWQEAIKREKTAGPSDPVTTGTGLAAKLLEGEWSKASSETNTGAEQAVRLGILSDRESGALADLLAADLSGQNALKLVERDAMDRIIAEQGLNRAGLLRGESLSKLSQLLAADALVLISGEEVDGKRLHRVRWVDARRGLLLGLSYVPEEKKTWSGFTERYGKHLVQAANKIRGEASNRIPVSLTGAHTNWATPAASQLERELALALQFALSTQDPFVLLERESLQRLARENRIAGEAGHRFQGSGIFIKARVDVDVTSEDLQQVVLQATRADGSEIATLRQAASRESLPATCVALATELSAQINASKAASSEEELQIRIASDRKEMVDEAYWLYRVGLHQQAFAVMENALALGANQPNAWKLYLAILDEETERLREDKSLTDTKFRALLNLEFERIRSLERYFRRLRETGNKRSGFRVNFDPDESIEGFSLTLHYMGAVTLQRRYSDEIRRLQDGFVRIFEDVIRPMLSEGAPRLSKHFSSSDKRKLRNACIWIAPRLGFQNKAAVEMILATALSGDHEAHWRYMVQPPPRLGGFDALDEWIREHGNTQSLSRYYGARADSHNAAYDPLCHARDPLSKTNGRGEIRYRSWNKQKLQRELDSLRHGLSGSDASVSPEAPLSGPLLKVWTVKGQNLECRTVEAQRVDAKIFRHRASHPDPEVYKATLPSLQVAPDRPDYFERFTDPKSARMQLNAGRALLLRLQSKDVPDKDFVSKYETFLVGVEERLDALKEGRQSMGPEIKTAHATYWEHEPFLPGGVNVLYHYPVNDSESLCYHDEAWWSFGTVKQKDGYLICAFRIDDRTLETEVKTFRSPGKGRITNQDVQFIVLSGSRIIIGTDSEVGTLVLNWQSGETATVPGFKACLFQDGRHWVRYLVHAGKVYYTAVPDYERDPYRARMNSLVFLELDPVSLQQKVLFNFRRNPPETPLDKPIESKYSNKGFDICFSETEGLFGFVHSGQRYAFDPTNSEFAKISSADARKIDRSALKIVNTWPTHNGKSDWFRFTKDGYEDLDLGAAVPLVLVDRKNDDAVVVVGLEFRNAPEVKNPPSDAYKAAILARGYNLRFYGYSDEHAVLRPYGQGIVFIKYQDLEPVLERSGQ